jgi:transposase
MIVIGADTHKSIHALVAVDADTGQLLGEREIVAKDAGHLEALRWAHELDEEVVWAIEDCRDFSSHHLEQALLAAGERVVRVARR